jgi:hypothetical protein
MKTYISFVAILVLAAAFTLACGSSSSSQHMLQSIAINPTAADASQYPDGQVPFEATGMYKTAPLQVKPLSVSWGTCGNEITVTTAGVAQCTPGAVGTFTVTAFGTNRGEAGCNITVACGYNGSSCSGFYASAKLTCP